MNISVVMVGVAICFILSIIVTGMLKQYALNHSLIDVPNERSSHLISTPRGGGLSIAMAILISTVILFISGRLQNDVTLAIGIGGFIVSAIGWIDDHRHIPVIWRALTYTIAAILAVYCLGWVDKIWLGIYFLPVGWIGSVLAIVWIVWMTNLYNFMDGTDALAAIESISVGLFAGILFWLEGQYGVAVVCFIIVASSCGFLYWNWSPAKIFMGDVGSCTLGFCFGVLTVIGEVECTVPFAVWFILLSIFICDTTLTLLMRIIKREKWLNAHCSHAYQRWLQMGASHKRLALSVLFINVLILWPMATMAYVWDEYSYHIAVFSIVLMSVIWGIIQMHYHRDYS
jgi:Fuc2NAc and GlcNAc transferase